MKILPERTKNDLLNIKKKYGDAVYKYIVVYLNGYINDIDSNVIAKCSVTNTSSFSSLSLKDRAELMKKNDSIKSKYHEFLFDTWVSCDLFNKIDDLNDIAEIFNITCDEYFYCLTHRDLRHFESFMNYEELRPGKNENDYISKTCGIDYYAEVYKRNK